MRKLTFAIARTPILGRAILLVFRAKIALGYLSRPLGDALPWLFKSREITNFTYDLDRHNRRYLASMIADVLNMEFHIIDGYIREIEEDGELRRSVQNATAKSGMGFMADSEVRFGRRIGWYAFVRAMKPNIIVETGVDKGLGSCVLTTALKRNQEEGYSGKYYGTDINPRAGYLLAAGYPDLGTILYGDSIQSLARIEGAIDLFINDSDHSADYEYREYRAVADKLSSRAIVLGDNSHCTDMLLRFSLDMGRHFLFFQEKPVKHWYPGAGIGVSFSR